MNQMIPPSRRTVDDVERYQPMQADGRCLRNKYIDGTSGTWPNGRVRVDRKLGDHKSLLWKSLCWKGVFPSSPI